MPYTPNAEDTAQPTGNQALSTAALEFRTLKTYIQATKTAQAAATALVASNLAAALVTQDTRDDAQDSAITAAAALGTTGIAAAAAALAVAQGKLTKEVLTGSGNWTVPAGVTSVLVVVQGGGSCEAEYSQGSRGGYNFSFFSRKRAGEVQVRSIATTPATTIAYSCGVGQQLQLVQGSYTTVSELVHAEDSSFGSVIAEAAISRYAFSQCSLIFGGGDYVSLANSVFRTSTFHDGRVPSIDLSQVALGTSSMTAGEAGSIHLFY